MFDVGHGNVLERGVDEVKRAQAGGVNLDFVSFMVLLHVLKRVDKGFHFSGST